MKPTEAVAVWRKVCAYQPNQPRDEMSAEVWVEAMAPYDVRDALEAVTKLGTADRKPGVPWLIEPRDVATECRTAQARRLEDRKHQLPDPPAEVADDPAAYLTWWRGVCRDAQARDWTPPAAIEAPTRPVKQLLGRAFRPTEPEADS